MCGNLNRIFKLIMKLVNMKTMKQQENIDHFHKWRQIKNSFTSIKISLNNLILKLIIQKNFTLK